MKSNFNLNCLVLGDHPRNIFPVKIVSTKLVDNLKDLIKEKTHAFRDLDADALQLWKVDLPVDDTLESNIDELKLDYKKALSPVDQMFEVFDTPPQRKHLHIVVQPLPARVPHSAGYSLINLNCLVLGDHPGNIFPVKIALTDTVGNLKELIKKSRTAFRDLDVCTLRLWKVDLPVDDSFERTVNELELDQQKLLSTVDGMFEVFDSPQYKHLHIVVEPLLPYGDRSHLRPSPSAILVRTQPLRGQYNSPQGAPPSQAKPSEFKAIQQKSDQFVYWN
ncbi:uncharacterized protein F5147DRAFT_768830 [Suillus discolor]|uniref:Crinkler effector protein N-terminal domain-containing protein n=1 Tax=Suillus discolor TaxID=1912936 RepID=A0A9P7FHR6_9AGAM|nr:uncharacterized protein F5147DRAFT_768830 [Suillus discolor]KAG2116465.1 hypothetical protein F5147DRAFT_768830 [Suillus discolor]